MNIEKMVKGIEKELEELMENVKIGHYADFIENWDKYTKRLEHYETLAFYIDRPNYIEKFNKDAGVHFTDIEFNNYLDLLIHVMRHNIYDICIAFNPSYKGKMRIGIWNTNIELFEKKNKSVLVQFHGYYTQIEKTEIVNK